MIQDTYQIYSGNSTQLYCASWQPGNPPKAVICFVHGLGEHLGRYEEIAKKFVEHQVAVFAFDHRGHGRSEGKRGHALSITQFIEDVEHVLMKCRSLYLDIPIFLFGHSMGGQIVATYLNRVKSKEVSGAIISSPWLELVNPPKQWKITISARLASIAPSLTVFNEIDPVHISGVPEEVQKYISDPLIHDRISFSLFNSLFRNGKYLMRQAEPCGVPVLVCHGDKDLITSPEASKRYANRLGKNATFKLWKGAHHEPHHDFEKDMVMDYYLRFIQDQVVAGK